jgi:LacI family transcriptional regulator
MMKLARDLEHVKAHGPGVGSGREVEMARVTLADVAHAAGVGVATASRALSPREHPDVSAATRERIRAVADELGYRPSLAARTFRNRDFRAVSIVVPDGQWGWWEPAVRAAHGAARARGCTTFVQPTTALRGDSGDVADVIAGLSDVPTEGVLVFGSAGDPRMLDSARSLRLPVVAIDNAADEILVPTFSVDSRHGVQAAIEHLVALGRSRIAYVGAPGGLRFQRERRDAYRSALAAAGLGPELGLMIEDPAAGDVSSLVLPRVEELLASGPEVDALLCESDRAAARVLRSLRRAGRRVPEDVSVVGFDDAEIARDLDPPLTTVRQPFEQLGSTAIELLLSIVEGAPAPAERSILAPDLVVRASTG